MSDATELWDVVATCIDSYLAACRPGAPLPSIEDFIPLGSPQLRCLAIVELAKLEMEQLSDQNAEFGIERYLKRFPELRECTGNAPLDLIIDEIRLRKLKGSCDERTYLDRFPFHRESLKRYFSFSDTTPSSSLGGGRVRTQLEAGQSIDDYELVRLLGSGAFAQVFLARQTTMQRLVALKISSDRGDEAKTLAQLDHPHIVRVYDVRRQPAMKLRLLSMQYAPGGTLQDVMHAAKEIPWRSLSGQVIVNAVDQQLLSAGLPPLEESQRRTKLTKATWIEAVCDIGIQLASALDCAHRQHVLHRDVKPANVLLTSEASCKLADFNISFSGELIGANPSSYFGGSLIYMSPEQLEATKIQSNFRPSDLDERSDVYSLAFLIWELLTVQRPWPKDQVQMDWHTTVDEVAARRRREEPVVNPQVIVSQQFTRVIEVLRRALAIDREARTASARELASQLRLCLSPDAWRLFHPELNRWTTYPLQWPYWIAAIAVFLPNGLAGMFNFTYNEGWMRGGAEYAPREFYYVSVVVNVLAFSIGGYIFHRLVYPITREVTARKNNRSTSSAFLSETFFVGKRTAMAGVLLWLISGIIFPMLLAIWVPEFDTPKAIHFFLSLAVCGAIAAAYPFLGMSLIAIECWYGVLIGKETRDDAFPERADRLIRWLDRYLLVATGVPLAGLLLLLGQDTPAKGTLLVLVLASAIGLFLAFRVHQRLRRMLEILGEVVVDPGTREP